MNWEALGAIGEIVGAVAVVVTLGYLAVQIRQNTREVRLAAFQNITDRAHRWNENISSDREIAGIYATGLVDPKSLNESERVRFEGLAVNQFRNWEDLFLHHRGRLLDKEVWEAKCAQIRIFLAEPGNRWLWRRRKATFTRSFQDFIDREISLLSSKEASRNGDS